MSQLIDSLNDSPQTEFGGEWWMAKPYINPFIIRLKNAWKVLKGTATAFHYKEDEIDILNKQFEKVCKKYNA